MEMLQPKQIKNDKTYMTIKGLVEGEYVKSKEYKFLIRILKHIKAYNVFTKNLLELYINKKNLIHSMEYRNILWCVLQPLECRYDIDHTFNVLLQRLGLPCYLEGNIHNNLLTKSEQEILVKYYNTLL